MINRDLLPCQILMHTSPFLIALEDTIQDMYQSYQKTIKQEANR
jgi:hypothetical protein